jgi:nucleotide-binding universal stress UspA family protein
VTALPPLQFDDYREAMESELESWCGTVAEQGVDHECLLVERDPATALIEESARLGARLVVLGAHGHSRWSRHLLGSVTAKVLHQAGAPVAVVPGEPAAPDRPGILVGVDGSEASGRALEWAAGLAGATGKQLRVVTVVPAELWHERPFFGTSDDPVAGAERFVAAAVGDGPAEIDVEVPIGDPAVELIERGDHADVLVVGSRGHTSIGEIVFGSVSRNCATRCARPVIVVPAGAGPEVDPGG